MAAVCNRRFRALHFWIWHGVVVVWEGMVLHAEHVRGLDLVQIGAANLKSFGPTFR